MTCTNCDKTILETGVSHGINPFAVCRCDAPIEQATVTLSVDSNFLLNGWLIHYGILMRQAQNSDYDKDMVVKACKRVLEDLEAFDD